MTETTDADACAEKEAVLQEVEEEFGGTDALLSQRKDSNDISLEESNSSVLSGLTETEHVEAPVVVQVVEETTLCQNKMQPPPSLNWVESLSSPPLSLSTSAFSPSLPSSSFGLALKLAANRASDLTKSGRRCATIVLSMADLYMAAASSYNTAASSILVLPSSSGGNNKLLLGLQQWCLQWSREYRKLGETLKATAQPMHSYLVVHGDATDGMNRRAQQARKACIDARKRELVHNANKKKKRSSSASEYSNKMPILAIPDLSDGNDNSSTAHTTITPIGKSSSLLMKSISSSSRSKTSEKEMVQQCQRLEQMALEQLRLQEVDRVGIVGTSLQKLLDATKECVEELSVMPSNLFLGENEEEREVEPVVSSSTRRNSRVKKHNFAKKLLKSGNLDMISNMSISDNNSASGAMDADTLGLPEEIGKLRDQVKVKISSRSSRLQLVRALAGVLETVASTSVKLGSGLKHLHFDHPGGDGTVMEASFISEHEAPITRKLWQDLMAAAEAESKASLALAASLQTLRRDKFDKVLLYGDRAIKSAIESDDFLWKQLCEAARHQSRVELKYMQTAAQTAKLRERLTSVDSDPGKNKKEASKVSQHVSKSIANMFSILPDGGDQAMKMFAPSARATIAAHSLTEADTRANKGRQQLDAATEAASRNLESYRSNASALVKQYDDDEKTTWDDVRAVMETFSTEIDDTRSSRLQGLGELVEYTSDFSYLEEFRADLHKQIESLVAETSVDDCCALVLDDEECEGDSASGSGKEDTKEDKPESSNNIDDEAGNDTSPSSVSENKEEDANSLQKDPIYPSSPQKSESSMHGALRRHVSGLCDTSPDHQSQLNQGSQLNIETEIFLSHFWQDPVDRDAVPPVLNSFACSFRDSSRRLPFQYGRVFVTSTRIIFNSWTGRKLNIPWTDVKDIERVPSDDALLLTSKRGENEEIYSILGGFCDRQQVLECLSKLREDAVCRSKQVEIQAPVSAPQSAVAVVPEVPPDSTLKRMETVLTRHLKSVSIQRFYEIAWSEGNGTNEKPLYGPWLGRVCFDIDVGDWQFQTSTGPWCGETYDQKRIIRFKVKRKTHLYIGPPIANVQQTHFCRREGNDKCVLGMTIEFEGIPYCDTFAVEVRWVARREGASDIRIDVGAFVDFRKNTLLKAKIRAGTIEETTPVHKSLFDAIKEACVAAGGQDVDEADEEVKESAAAPEAANPVVSMITNNPTLFAYCCAVVVLLLLWRSLFRQSGVVVVPPPPSQEFVHLDRRIDGLEVEIKAVQATLQELLVLLKSQQQSVINE